MAPIVRWALLPFLLLQTQAVWQKTEPNSNVLSGENPLMIDGEVYAMLDEDVPAGGVVITSRVNSRSTSENERGFQRPQKSRIRIPPYQESEFLELVKDLNRDISGDLVELEKRCLVQFHEKVCNVLLLTAMPQYSPSLEPVPRDLFVALMKAVGAVVATLVIVIYVYGHVEQRRRVAESAIDYKYSGNGQPEEYKSSFLVRGVAKLDFGGNEIFSNARPSVNDLLGDVRSLKATNSVVKLP